MLCSLIEDIIMSNLDSTHYPKKLEWQLKYGLLYPWEVVQPNELYSGVNKSIISNLIATVWLLFQQETKALLSNKQYPVVEQQLVGSCTL